VQQNKTLILTFSVSDDSENAKTSRNKTNGTTQGVLKINPSNAELNPICHLLALLGGATIVVVSRLRVNHRNNTHVPGKYYFIYNQPPAQSGPG
jgi:hypothetical protein